MRRLTRKQNNEGDTVERKKCFPCKFCSESFASRFSTERHYESCSKNPSHKVNVYKCICDTEFTKIGYYERHKNLCKVVKTINEKFNTVFKDVNLNGNNNPNITNNNSNNIATNSHNTITNSHNNISNVNSNTHNIIHIHNFHVDPPKLDPNVIKDIIEYTNEIDQYTGKKLNILEGAIRKIIEYHYINNPEFRNIYCNSTNENAKTYLSVTEQTWKPISKTVAHSRLLDISLSELMHANTKLKDYFNDNGFNFTDYNGNPQQFIKSVKRLYFLPRKEDEEDSKRYKRLVGEVLMENHEVVNNNYKKMTGKDISIGLLVP